jgi:hypothetical protein
MRASRVRRLGRQPGWMIQVVERLAGGDELTAEELGVSPAHKGRAVLYVRQAARVLNLIDDESSLTAQGARLANSEIRDVKSNCFSTCSSRA